MAERLGAIPASRSTEDILMGAFGTPDTANTLTITTSGTAAANTNLKQEKWYRFYVTADAYIHMHPSEAATALHLYMKSGVPEMFYTGTNTRVSALQVSSAGTVFMTPMITNVRVV